MLRKGLVRELSAAIGESPSIACVFVPPRLVLWFAGLARGIERSRLFVRAVQDNMATVCTSTLSEMPRRC